MISSMAGKIQTVLGAINPEELGITMSHEHLLIDFSVVFEEPKSRHPSSLASEPVSMGILGWLRYNWRSNRDNLVLDQEDIAIEEASRFADLGGCSIVDATNIGIGRNPLGLMRISEATGLNIIMGTSHYVAASHPPDMRWKSEEDLTNEIVRDITIGVDNSGVKSGIIGEIGCSWPWDPNEKKAVRAGGQAHKETGAPLLIHPGRHEDSPFEIIKELEKIGVDLERTVISHVERTIFSREKMLTLAKTGVILEWDLFGHESSYYPFSDNPMPNDSQRIDQIRCLIEEGFGDQIVIAHDICTKHRLTKYGGHGFSHILDNVIPRMNIMGISETQIDKMLIATPSRILTFV